ncbi:hypothetical protein JG688_00006513 [Phytophthora aleatoria]|uniref:Uncharacterized protein n=1 Tax=Phytophthora aleatoria TaxID=2496075 RepID=A0A8J5J0U9_9STRA|nr:hypothetical protein JG688_00006513 [Phytophthora aleatoria]
MCETHREYQRSKIKERRATKAPRKFQSTQCRYPPGCRNPRAKKKNGELHWLCDEHRQQQNELQRQRQRREKSRMVAANNTKTKGLHRTEPKGRQRCSKTSAVALVGLQSNRGKPNLVPAAACLAEQFREPTISSERLEKINEQPDHRLGQLAETVIAERERALRQMKVDRQFRQQCAKIWSDKIGSGH